MMNQRQKDLLRYGSFVHGFVAARDPKNPRDTLLALQEAETSWTDYCVNGGLSFNLESGSPAVDALLHHVTREALSQHEVFVHGFVAARSAKAHRLSLLMLDEAETAWRVHLGHAKETAHV